MRRILIVVLFILAYSGVAHAQLGNVTLKHFAGAPSGTCLHNQQAMNDATGAFYDCVAGVWTSVGGGGSSAGAQYSPQTSDGAGGFVAVVPGTTKGIYQMVENAPTDAAVAPTLMLVGLVANQGTGGAILFSDNNGIIRNPGATLSLATPTTLENTNFFTIITTPNGTATTITPTTWTISLNGATAGATAVCPAKATCKLYVDQVTATQWDLDTTYLAGHGLWQGCGSRGLGDGLNAITAGTYLQFACVNDTGATVTITGIRCWTDNAGTSTLNAANNAATALLTGAVTCNNTKASGGAAGSQSGTTTLASGDAISFTFVADGTSKQTNWTVSGTY